MSSVDVEERGGNDTVTIRTPASVSANGRVVAAEQTMVPFPKVMPSRG